MQDEPVHRDEPAGPLDDPAPTSAELQRLEEEHADLQARYIALLEADNAKLRDRVSESPTYVTPSGAPADVAVTPPYIASALVDIEQSLTDMEMMARVGRWAEAANAKLAAANRACSVLSAVTRDPTFIRQFGEMQLHMSEFRQKVLNMVAPNSTTAAEFGEHLAKEYELLRLIGLTEELARAHVDQGAAALRAAPTVALDRIESPTEFLVELETLREASCTTADLLIQGIKHARSRARWRKILTFGVGGILVIGANAGAATIIGPAAAAVSGAIGSAAFGEGVKAATA